MLNVAKRMLIVEIEYWMLKTTVEFWKKTNLNDQVDKNNVQCSM